MAAQKNIAPYFKKNLSLSGLKTAKGRKLGARTLDLLSHIIYLARNGKCLADNRHFAKTCDVSERQIRYHLKTLQEAHCIQVILDKNYKRSIYVTPKVMALISPDISKGGRKLPTPRKKTSYPPYAEKNEIMASESKKKFELNNLIDYRAPASVSRLRERLTDLHIEEFRRSEEFIFFSLSRAIEKEYYKNGLTMDAAVDWICKERSNPWKIPQKKMNDQAYKEMLLLRKRQKSEMDLLADIVKPFL